MALKTRVMGLIQGFSSLSEKTSNQNSFAVEYDMKENQSTNVLVNMVYVIFHSRYHWKVRPMVLSTRMFLWTKGIKSTPTCSSTISQDSMCTS